MSNEKYEKGLKIRTQVLGEDYVNRSIQNADDFSKPLQELVTEYCWGHVWGRDGLSLKERSMINLAMISALNRPHELKLHIRGALRNGLSREQIREILLRSAFIAACPRRWTASAWPAKRSPRPMRSQPVNSGLFEPRKESAPGSWCSQVVARQPHSERNR